MTTNRKEWVLGKFKVVKYTAFDSKCNKRWCFIPFNGNGQAICRALELGNCNEGKLKNPGTLRKEN